MFWMLLLVTCQMFVKMPLWVFILMLVMTCYVILWVLLKFQTSNSWRKRLKKFHENLSKFICENDDLIAKLNESNKLVKNYKNLAEHSLEKLIEFECLNVDLNAKLVLFNKLVDDLKCENKFLKTKPSVWLLNLVLKR